MGVVFVFVCLFVRSLVLSRFAVGGRIILELLSWRRGWFLVSPKRKEKQTPLPHATGLPEVSSFPQTTDKQQTTNKTDE